MTGDARWLIVEQQEGWAKSETVRGTSQKKEAPRSLTSGIAEQFREEAAGKTALVLRTTWKAPRGRASS